MNENILICHPAAGTVGVPERPRILAIGVFDGVHFGHRAIVAAAAALAARLKEALPAALTFQPHPRELFRPGEAPEPLTPFEERCQRLLEAGAAEVRVAEFTRAFAALPPDAFLDALQQQTDFRVGGIAVGENWRFGCGGSGDATFLQQECRRRDLLFAAVPLVRINGETVSSTAIRAAVKRGDLPAAQRLLGRPFAMTGRVVQGYRDATAKLECPTANLETSAPLPPDGVYYGIVLCNGIRYAAAANVGECPTFQRARPERRVELHLMTADAPDLYGERLTFIPRQRLREERKFTSPDALKRQIALDLEEIRRLALQDQLLR